MPILNGENIRYRTGKTLTPFRMSGNIEWGVPVPEKEGLKDLTFYCWPESLWAPISFTRTYLKHNGFNDDEWKNVDVNVSSAIFANLCAISEKAFSLNSMLTELHEEYSRLTSIDCLKLPKAKLDCLWEKAVPYIDNPVSSKATYYHVFGTKSLPEHENPRVILWNGSVASLREHIWDLFDGESCRWTQLEKCNIFRIKKKDKYVVPAYNSFRNFYSKNKLP